MCFISLRKLKKVSLIILYEMALTKTKLHASIYQGVGSTTSTLGDTYSSIFSEEVSEFDQKLFGLASYTSGCTLQAQGSWDNTIWVNEGSEVTVAAGADTNVSVTKPYPYLRLRGKNTLAGGGSGNAYVSGWIKAISF